MDNIPPKVTKKIETVVFFNQSIMPYSKESRFDVLDTLVQAARKNPKVNFLVKLRHLEIENKIHTHREEFSFQALAREAYPLDFPDNLTFTAKFIDDVLKEADLCITCASTAGLEAIGAGVHTLFFNSYKGAETDFHHASMVQFAAGSGLLCVKNDVINLNLKLPNTDWLNENMSNASMAANLEIEIQNFNHWKSIIRKPVIGLLVPRLFMKLVYKFL